MNNRFDKTNGLTQDKFNGIFWSTAIIIMVIVSLMLSNSDKIYGKVEKDKIGPICDEIIQNEGLK